MISRRHLAASAALAWLLAPGAPRSHDGTSQSMAAEDTAGMDEFNKDTNLDYSDMVNEGLRKLGQERNRDGLKALKAKDYPKALEKFQQAYELSPEDAEIANNLGYIYQLLGNSEAAEVHYRAAMVLDSSRLITYLNLADLLSVKGESMKRLSEASELLSRARELRGNRLSIIVRQARVAALRGDFAMAERYYLELGNLKGTPAKTILEIGDFYRDFGHPQKALTWYRLVEDEELSKLAAARIFELEAEREARKLGWSQRVEVVGSRARALATRGRLAASQGKFEEAERLLSESLAMAPTFAEARADLGDLYRRTARWEEAEMSYLRALATEPGSPEIAARLGELYVNQGRGAEAAYLLSRALDARPDWHALHLTLAKALRAAGDLRSALARVDRYLVLAAQGERRTEALELKTAISKLVPGSRERGGIARSLANIERTRTMDPEIAQALAKVKLHLSEERPDAAMAELRLLAADKRGKDVLNLEGRILMSSGRMDEAASILLDSLSLEPDQLDVHEQLGAIYDTLEKPLLALEHYGRAERLGSPAASYHLARLTFPRNEDKPWVWLRDLPRVHELHEARGRVQTFLGNGTSSLYLSDAKVLAARLGQRLYTAISVWVGLCVISMLIGWALAWRLIGGATLAELARHHPESGPEVRRVMAAIRHEVLKHNTVVLGGFADALSRQDPDLDEKAAHLCSLLWGKRGSDGGVAARLDNYTKELIKIGRAHGVRLNLARKDPALSSLRQGFRVLEGARGRMERVGRLGPHGRSQLLRALRRAFELLNVRGYDAVSASLNELKSLSVDISLLEAIARRVHKEPAFMGHELAAPIIETDVPLPLNILVARRDFEDILANLLRNALASSLSEPQRPAQIGLSIELQQNEITGIETLVIAVHDRSKEALTTEMIRGRYIERGLGLIADLISRYDGSIDVVTGPADWSKSVRVRLPLTFDNERAQGGA